MSQILIYVNQGDSWLAETVYGIIEGSVGNKLKNKAKSYNGNKEYNTQLLLLGRTTVESRKNL